MLIEMIRFLFILAAAIGGYHAAIEFGWPGTDFNKNFAIILYMILGSGIGYVGGGVLGRRFVKALGWVEDTLQNVPLSDLILGLAGLVFGMVVAFLVTLPLDQIEIVELRLFLITFVYITLASLGLRLGMSRRDEVSSVLHWGKPDENGASGLASKILDTNIVIDGRVLDIAKAGFLEGKIILPRFVLDELHTLADSADAQKRARARRGLDVLNSLQDTVEGHVEIVEADYPDLRGVDAKLVRLAIETGASIITNDFNLNKVATLEGVRVLNLNDLAKAVKPAVLPGEQLEIKVVHEGKEQGQGVGYLDDGTMVVVEGGRDVIGELVQLKVTSMLQTSAGKMIFSKMKTAETA